MSSVFKTRVYYQDTDSAGVVYHARYLNFFDKARVESLRDMGISIIDLSNNFNVVFVVGKINIEYLTPARLEDNICIVSSIESIKKVSLIFSQVMKLNNEDGRILSKAEVKLGCVDCNSFRPTIIPEVINKNFVAGA